jgi:chain length determinant protein EpsF
MNPLQFLLALRARYKVALSVVVVAVVSAAVVSVSTPKQYVAETAVMVDIKSPDPVSSILLPATFMPASLGTQVDIIMSDRVARKVVRILQLDQKPSTKDAWLGATGGRGKIEDWLADRLQKRVKVTPSRDSNLINISYRGTDPAFVAAVANAYAQAYIEASIELKVEPARQYARWFGDQAKALRETVEQAQGRLSDFQRKNGILASGGGEGRGGDSAGVDFETARLNELSAKLVAAQTEAADARNKQRLGAVDSMPEVQQNPVISRLRLDIAALDAKLKDAAGNLGVNHPQYLRMQSELAAMRTQLQTETRLVASGFSSSSAVSAGRQAELQAAIDAQKKKILDLKGKYDELAVLVRDVETAKRAYEAVTNRLTQTNLESQATQTNISVLTPAVEPLESVFPKPLEQMLLIAFGGGILLACAVVFGLEMLDHRVRSAQDLAEMLQLPVLGTVTRATKPGRLPFRRALPALALK